MNISDLANQWPALAILVAFCAVLLRTLQSVYVDQIKDLRRDRDELRAMLDRATLIAEQSTGAAEGLGRLAQRRVAGREPPP